MKRIGAARGHRFDAEATVATAILHHHKRRLPRRRDDESPNNWRHDQHEAIGEQACASST
jgi:hypothetical protein